MFYHVLVQPEGGHIIINAIIIRSWRMASILLGVTEGLDILQHTP
jgi:hypothetical protein